ncbi:MAG: hypothetical protein ACI8S6_002480 [Myxococcota bacterium]|jgi:hypothetical protein
MTSALIALCTLLAAADAASLAGVTMPDTATIGGQPVVLNGMGLREKYWIDVYVGGLYLPSKTTDAARAIADDVPKKIVMQFTYALDKAKLSETMSESISRSSSAEVAAQAPRLAGWMEDVAPGDQVVLEYVPGQGTSIIVKGTKKGTIPGIDFMQALFEIYLGAKPPTADLKSGLLGG